MAIVIFGDNFSFPEGDASTNRVYTYARGISENGIITPVMVRQTVFTFIIHLDKDQEVTLFCCDGGKNL
jgi:hypothetical protein